MPVSVCVGMFQCFIIAYSTVGLLSCLFVCLIYLIICFGV